MGVRGGKRGGEGAAVWLDNVTVLAYSHSINVQHSLSLKRCNPALDNPCSNSRFVSVSELHEGQSKQSNEGKKAGVEKQDREIVYSGLHPQHSLQSRAQSSSSCALACNAVLSSHM